MKTYDFKTVDCIVAGQNAYGFMDGDDSIAITYDTDAYELTVGSDGEYTRSKSNNNSATLKLKLQSTSSFNDVLNGYLQSDRSKNGGLFPFLLKDRSGRELHAAEQMWVQKAPDAGHGTKMGAREWTLRTGSMQSNYGGNN